MIKKPIKISEYAKMTVEDNNYTLYYRVKAGVAPGKKVATKEWTWILGGYFPTASSALQDFVANAPIYTPEELSSLRELADCIKTAQARLVEILGA